MNEKGEECSKNELNDAFFEELSEKFADYMTKSLEDKISKITAKIENLSKGDRKDKDKLISKFNNLLGITTKLKEKIKEQTELQNEVIKLTEEKMALEEEIDKILLSQNG